MYTLISDVQTTRRQRLHYVMDEHDAIAWTGKILEGAIDFLISKSQTRFIISDGNEKRYVCTIEEVS